jgi:hypothetical protein
VEGPTLQTFFTLITIEHRPVFDSAYRCVGQCDVGYLAYEKLKQGKLMVKRQRAEASKSVYACHKTNPQT